MNVAIRALAATLSIVALPLAPVPTWGEEDEPRIIERLPVRIDRENAETLVAAIEQALRNSITLAQCHEASDSGTIGDWAKPPSSRPPYTALARVYAIPSPKPGPQNRAREQFLRISGLIIL
jgi:hypothetical protein